jgi:hypothetical protein
MKSILLRGRGVERKLISKVSRHLHALIKHLTQGTGAAYWGEVGGVALILM